MMIYPTEMIGLLEGNDLSSPRTPVLPLRVLSYPRFVSSRDDVAVVVGREVGWPSARWTTNWHLTSRCPTLKEDDELEGPVHILGANRTHRSLFHRSGRIQRSEGDSLDDISLLSWFRDDCFALDSLGMINNRCPTIDMQ